MSERERDKEDQLDHTIIRELYMRTFRGEWEDVEKLYERNPEVWSAEITSAGDTALHMAINEDKDVAVRLVDIIVNAANGGGGQQEDHREKAKRALKKKNEVGDTPLHRAAARGSVKMCKRIVEAAKKWGEKLLGITNKWSENPMLVAVLDNRKQAFIYLYSASDEAEVKELLAPAKGDTVLHAAIRREHYDLAFHILRLCPDLVGRYNELGMTPLHILASKPSAFTSGSHLSWWQSIIYHCIRVDSLELCDTSHPEGRPESGCPHNYRTRYEFLSSLRCGRSVDPENHVRENVPENCVTWFQFLFMVLRNVFGVLRFANIFDEIIKVRQKHTWSVQILDELMKDSGNTYVLEGGSDPGSFSFGVLADSPDHQLENLRPKAKQDEKDNWVLYLGPEKEGVYDIESITRVRIDMSGGKKKDDGAPDRNDTALLVAAQKGVLEVVSKILKELPVSIHDTSSNKKNIVLVAVENRQPRIFKALDKHLNEVLKKPKLWQDLVRAVDADDNTILHLAAKCEKSKSHAWQIHGSAMQMQWEIKWYELVKSFVPPHFVFLANKEGKTPVQIFTEEHKDLVKESSEWLKETSESCSVVAALVAGVSFATSSQVPGGTDDQTGRPKLEGQPAFEIFAVTALIGLCFSVTALIMFLSILTSRKQPKDFRRNLPLKILVGLSSLFVSIASMLISFCAAHFFVLEDKFKKGVFPLYAATCLPVSFYAIAQFPLYMDLLKSIVRRIPQSHHFEHL